MIPSILTSQLKEGVEEFLRTTFSVSTPFFHGFFDNIFSDENGIFKGPYVSINLPFKTGKSGKDYFPDVPLNYKPYLHQEKSFDRLKDSVKKSTVIATGTGSGKTECFLYPLLNHCYKNKESKGIKAILVYPMNALAGDQAERIAKIIWNNPKLKNTVTAGLYIGQREEHSQKVMGAEKIITDRTTLQLTPPDILLTNYKMLDYLLVRPKDAKIWQFNEPETLQYIVVDELHTFDGAQGTDLACLIRRLKKRLETPEKHLCCIGTSATLGNEKDAGHLRNYADKIFGETFDENSVVTESRKTAGEFLEDSLITYVESVSVEQNDKLSYSSYDTYEEYITAQVGLWFGTDIKIEEFENNDWRIELGKKLKEHLLFQNLLKILRKSLLSFDKLIDELNKVTRITQSTDKRYRINLLNSIIALISEAKEESKGVISPFLHVRFQLWLRELRRMVCEVQPNPKLCFSDDLRAGQEIKHLPIVHCRECGTVGWAGTKRKTDSIINSSLDKFYIDFFGRKRQTVFLFPDEDESNSKILNGELCYVCPSCLKIQPEKKSGCDFCDNKNMIQVFIPHKHNNNCPYCNGRGSLTILGSRAASLTSIFISQIFNSDYNNDKKLLTFSDSVQDAAHRAGFFAARTYSFNFRSAIQQCLAKQEKMPALNELPEIFCDYWDKNMDKESYITTFIAPNLLWLEDYGKIVNAGQLPKGSKLQELINKRIKWEILSEYGFRTRIGRTLEKSDCSTVYPNSELFESAAESLLEPLKNEIGGLRKLDIYKLKKFLVGLITHIKNNGALFHPDLEEYVRQGGNPYLISQTHKTWMPNFGRNTRTPIFLTDKPATKYNKFNLVISKKKSSKTWYQLWAEKCFIDINPMIASSTDVLYEQVLRKLIKAGICDKRTLNDNYNVWGLKPESLSLSINVKQFECELCGNNVSVANEQTGYWENAPCLRRNCSGTLIKKDSAENYYKKMYENGSVIRLVAEEHTGLLDRDTRQKVESAFKRKEQKPWDPNLLSCTPTLEMGIDIGNLSSLILCSVPPTQSNYIQRIGRAGRRDGNSLCLTVVNNRPHDLYFFEEPEEMITGEIEPPDVFLNASAVLERQLTAFCFDMWVRTGISEKDIPKKLSSVLANLESLNEKKFPYNILKFIDENRENIFNAFKSMFSDSLTKDSISNLNIFLEGNKGDKDSLRYKIINGLFDKLKERKELKRKIQLLRKRITQMEGIDTPDDTQKDELDDLRCERSALIGLMKKINELHTYNFFTDEGYLPNYAFPEAGIMLKSIIYRKRQNPVAGEKKYEHWIYEMERPAASAIVELAPNNNFYSQGRKVTIDQIDMSVSTIENWRLCNQCNYIELTATEDKEQTCPRCGSTMWSDEGQKSSMIRLKQVIANTNDNRSRILDDSDQRTPKYYNKIMFVDSEKKDIEKAYKIDSEETPFGFEFLSKATFRSINFGPQENSSVNIDVAGQSLESNGFTICSVCGKVQLDINNEIKHSNTCTARDKESSSNLSNYIYLYREFSSEAIEILMPVTSFVGSKCKEQSFIAAIHLGLKKKYGGKISHINSTIYDELVEDSNYRKKYLVLYDTIPGGTGYLKEIMQTPNAFIGILREAITAMQSCDCNNDTSKDGCYHCLLSYGNSRDMEEISRTTAIELLQTIVAQSDKLIETDTIKNIKVNALFDSELEASFLNALSKVKYGKKSAQIEKRVVNGKPGYFYSIGDKSYYIELQVPLSESEGVSVPSKADFVFYPADRNEKTKTKIKPIVVFTDGLKFHKDRVAVDMKQRQSIVQSGKYNVWSITWKDVENIFKPLDNYYVELLKTSRSDYNNFLQHFDAVKLKDSVNKTSFDWLITYLKDPDNELWQRFAFVNALMNINSKTTADEWYEELGKYIGKEIANDIKENFDNNKFGVVKSAGGAVMVFNAVSNDAVSEKKYLQLNTLCCLNVDNEVKIFEEFESNWNGYLRLYNLMQFLPNTIFATLNDKEVDGFVKAEIAELPKSEKKENESWEEIFELTENEIHPLLDLLVNNKCPIPQTGYELTDDNGEIIATAELAWEEMQTAVLTESDKATSKHFIDKGWEIISLSSVLKSEESANKLIETINK